MKITVAVSAVAIALAAAAPGRGQNVPEPVKSQVPPSPARAELLRLQGMTARFAPVPRRFSRYWRTASSSSRIHATPVSGRSARRETSA